jgi:hypothetical protein
LVCIVFFSSSKYKIGIEIKKAADNPFANSNWFAGRLSAALQVHKNSASEHWFVTLFRGGGHSPRPWHCHRGSFHQKSQSLGKISPIVCIACESVKRIGEIAPFERKELVDILMDWHYHF